MSNVASCLFGYIHTVIALSTPICRLLRLALAIPSDKCRASRKPRPLSLSLKRALLALVAGMFYPAAVLSEFELS